jgi:hypothetical protein
VTGDLSLNEQTSRRRQNALQKRLDRHRAGIIQARADLTALVENANAQRKAHGRAIGLELEEVPLEAALNGSLTREQMITLQEVSAASFEDYIRSGNAPSEKLEGVFARMKEWLKKLYRTAKTMGVKTPDNVARVFDRMLANDTAIANSRLRAAYASEDAMFEAIEGIDPEEYAALQELRNRAEAEVSAALDKKTLKDRNKRWKIYYREGRDIADGDPLWKLIDALSVKKDNPFSGISRASLVRQYGEAFVRDLTKTHYGKKIVSREGGSPLDTVGINDILGGMASSMGFDDTHGLFDYLYDNIVGKRRTKDGDARTYAEARLADDDRQAEAEALEKGPGQAYAEYLDEIEALALRMAARQASAWRTPEQQARWVERNRLPRARIVRQVRDELQALPIAKIRLANYSSELARALQERNAALVEGKAMDALRAVDRARVALPVLEQRRVVHNFIFVKRVHKSLATVHRPAMLFEAPRQRRVVQKLDFHLGQMGHTHSSLHTCAQNYMRSIRIVPCVPDTVSCGMPKRLMLTISRSVPVESWRCEHNILWLVLSGSRRFNASERFRNLASATN